MGVCRVRVEDPEYSGLTLPVGRKPFLIKPASPGRMLAGSEEVPGISTEGEAHVKDNGGHLGGPLSRVEMGPVTYYSESLSIWKVCCSGLSCV